ncbi:MAG: tRNA pseudouridine(38-40) synthase TruA [Pirellulaceae bacterium]|nr:tRNA pseudouridine(38-40) synthase TruA [Pirellulaceae bacterium]
MRCLKMTVAYRGTHYCGWQIQNGQNSIQQELESAFRTVTGETVRMTASGRTDSGVHALGQVVSTAIRSEMECHQLLRALNGNTPFDISVLKVEEAVPRFHAIRDATKKSYRYRIQSGPVSDPIDQDFLWYVPFSLDVAAMQSGCEYLVGEHDFVCFQASGGATKSTIRTVFQCQIREAVSSPFRKLELDIEGSGFLYNMVRIIAGSLVEIGKGKRQPDWIAEIIQSKDRTKAGPTAPPQGLFLMNVDY